MSVWWALFFMGLGGAVVGIFNAIAWRKYYEGRKEWLELQQPQQYRRKE